ncbi:polymorphic toxin-type HINT domain-containing protein [Streptomyces lichenis]|uniref:HINT domain-containing protein n=1 Tax=Streptomyces lichenis TaxID=2306967 RepID=A0ABT0I5F4_9ACTN|nr:polymorphic toxin-type HINT domain-containing protein [Streptomyces lichenis]MCK8676544.1 HINT domain-containing protein [Streptomyces lichenis]
MRTTADRDLRARREHWRREVVDQGTTPVLMGDARAEPIEKVRVGDQVLATDPRTGRTEAQPVQATIAGQGAKALVDVAVSPSESDSTDSVAATGTHPFWVGGCVNSWTYSADIEPGMLLRTSAGATAEVAAIRSWNVPEQRVHNLTVAELHTYYVMAGKKSVLVYNCDAWTSPGNLDDHYTRHGPEMGYETQIEYEEAAKDLMCECDGTRPGVLVKDVADDGTVRFFDRESGEFGMKSKKGIITFYKLEGGLQAFKNMPGTIRPRRRRRRSERGN